MSDSFTAQHTEAIADQNTALAYYNQGMSVHVSGLDQTSDHGTGVSESEMLRVKVILLERFGIRFPSVVGLSVTELKDLLHKKQAEDRARRVADETGVHFIEED